ncbi:hypothetical protein [Solirubrobacter soli]|uniref:hypothetical protein n=1 Tax=Solirubrobacter soli TaxID=363832 RepID=UPI0005616FDC|nr:hypothetical protein [Solirubrobacter soli]
MQQDRTVSPARVAGSVRGLGVCDALRVEVAPAQWAGLERGVGERIAALERRVVELRSAGERDELDRAREALRLLTRMKTDLPGSVVTGPADLVVELVETCLADAIARVSERLTAGSPRCAGWMDELEAAGAWVATALDCAVVTEFCFEPGLDPVRW